MGAPPPDNAPHGRIAFKTGTSYGYRDAWAIGFDGRMTIGVWVGRPDGAPVPGLYGRASAAPILFDAFARSGFTPVPLPQAPKGTIFAANSKLPPPLQRFNAGTGLREATERPRIMFPPDGARLELAGGDQPNPVALKISRRPRAADRHGERRAACGRERPAHIVLPSGRSRICPPDGDGCDRRHRQRIGEDAVALPMTARGLGSIVRPNLRV